MLHKTKSTIAYNLICTYNLTQMHVTFVYRKYTLCFLKKKATCQFCQIKDQLYAKCISGIKPFKKRKHN